MNTIEKYVKWISEQGLQMNLKRNGTYNPYLTPTVSRNI
jgi:hypothetical protein